MPRDLAEIENRLWEAAEELRANSKLIDKAKLIDDARPRRVRDGGSASDARHREAEIRRGLA